MNNSANSNRTVTAAEVGAVLIATGTVMVQNKVCAAHAAANEFDEARTRVLVRNGVDGARVKDLLELDLSAAVELDEGTLGRGVIPVCSFDASDWEGDDKDPVEAQRAANVALIAFTQLLATAIEHETDMGHAATVGVFYKDNAALLEQVLPYRVCKAFRAAILNDKDFSFLALALSKAGAWYANLRQEQEERPEAPVLSMGALPWSDTPLNSHRSYHLTKPLLASNCISGDRTSVVEELDMLIPAGATVAMFHAPGAGEVNYAGRVWEF